MRLIYKGRFILVKKDLLDDVQRDQLEEGGWSNKILKNESGKEVLNHVYWSSEQ